MSSAETEGVPGARVGDILHGKYRVDRVLGAGGMGVVVAATHLQLDDKVEYVLQACEALAEAHAAGIVHRDLKPANLFLIQRADGSPCIKVLDFGISKMVGSLSMPGMTKTTAVMGSPLYMSPEQMNSSRDVDARSDIWALGIVLYQLVAGVTPFSSRMPS